jgi:hypothetical protein
MTKEDAVAGIAATTTYHGLKCTAVLDGAGYPEGVKVSDERMRHLQDRVLDRDAFHGEWNYAVRPAPLPAPEPAPGPAPAGRCPQGTLNHPALTGLDPGDLRELAAALEVPFGARREQAGYARRGGRRVNAVRNGGGPNGNRRIDLPDHVLALRFRDHLGVPSHLTAALLGADDSTVRHAIRLAAQLIAENRIPLPSAGPRPTPRLRTPADLAEYAAAAGISLTLPDIHPKTPKYTRTRQAPATHPS